MKAKIKHYLKEIVLFILFIIVASNIISLYKSQSLNKQALTLEKVKLIDNSTYSISDKKPLLLHVWATWCPICKAEADNLQRLSQYYQVVTIAVSSGTDFEIHEYMNKRGFNYKVVNDKDGRIAEKLGVSVYPTTFIYDKNGKNIFSEVGYTSTFALWLRMLWAS